MWKRMFFSMLAAGTLAAAWPSACPAEEVTGVGASPGIHGDDIVVEVTATPQELISITILEQNETDGIGSVACEILPEAMLSEQRLDVDDVSGATVSSTAIKTAAAQALESAGIDPAAFTGTQEAEEPDEADGQVFDTDVVIVGAGGAGMSAAIEAVDAGLAVLVIESQPMVGGNSLLSTGGMNAAKTPYQDENEFHEAAGVEEQLETAAESYADNEAVTSLAEKVREQWEAYQTDPEGYFDSEELFALDTMIGGKGINDIDLVKTLAQNSAEAVNWLDFIGAPLPDVSIFGGASVKRIHRPVDDEGKTLSVGTFLVPVLEENLTDRGVDVMLNTTAQSVITKDGAAAGIRAVGPDGEKVTVNAKAVVLATGGFGASLEKVVEERPDLEGYMTTNAPGALGQGIDMARELGADTVDMDQIQVHPTVHRDTGLLITESLRGDGAILVNEEARRFTDELGTRDVVSAAVMAQTGSHCYLILDQAMADASNVIQGYIDSGLTVEGETYEDLAGALGIDPETFRETMDQWNICVRKKEDPEFGRNSFASLLDSAPFYAIDVTAGIHHTMGGLKINADAEVLDTEGNPIPGLFAAGEVTGGVHGANRLGGNAVADFVVYGRIAGQNAAACAMEES